MKIIFLDIDGVLINSQSSNSFSILRQLMN